MDPWGLVLFPSGYFPIFVQQYYKVELSVIMGRNFHIHKSEIRGEKLKFIPNL